MDTSDRVFERSLRCLQHPLSVLSIALLLVNDHVLKSLNPSWITGKLSDFAGLFFFPFIVSAGVGLLPLKLKDGRRSIGLFSFGITGVWFLLLKTLPLANAFSNQLASSILGRPVSFALDWTDCFALIVLVPGWLLWNGYAVRLDRRMALASLTVGTLASLATSPAPMPGVFVALAQRGSYVYALAENHGVYFSSDQGLTWESCGREHRCPFSPEQMVRRPFTIEACDPAAPSTCYRITGRAEVETTNDAGATWSVAWQIPPGRRIFVERSGGIAIPQDLIILVAPRRVLIVAMQDDGLLRRELPDGPWERIPMEYSWPTPFEAESLDDAVSIVLREIALWLGVALVAVLLGGTLMWNRVRPEGFAWRRLCAWILSTILLSLVLIFLVGLLSALFVWLLIVTGGAWLPRWLDDDTVLFSIMAGLAYLATFLALGGRFRDLERTILPAQAAHPRLVAIVVVMAVGIAFLGPIAWPLWALGVISDYNAALLLSLAITVVIAAAGYLLLLRLISPDQSSI